MQAGRAQAVHPRRCGHAPRAVIVLRGRYLVVACSLAQSLRDVVVKLLLRRRHRIRLRSGL